jgi:hypothetical protein
MMLANVIYSFIVMATVIMIVKYDRTVFTIVSYDPKTFIVQATGLNNTSFTNPWVRHKSDPKIDSFSN